MPPTYAPGTGYSIPRRQLRAFRMRGGRFPREDVEDVEDVEDGEHFVVGWWCCYAEFTWCAIRIVITTPTLYNEEQP